MCSTPEYKTLISLTTQLTHAVQDDLISISGDLLAESLISRDAASRLNNRMHSKAERAAEMIELIQNKVQQNFQHYHKFVQVLKKQGQEYYGDILGRLQEVYQQHTDGNNYYQQPVSPSESGIASESSNIKHRHIPRTEADDGSAKEEVNLNLKVKLTRQDSQSCSIVHAGRLSSYLSICGFVFLIGVAVIGAFCYYGPWQPGSENGFQSINQQKECTKIESSRVLFKELEEVGSWEHLCHNLGVSTATVNSLNLDHAQNTEKKRRCLEAFYKDKEPRVQVCWETVVKAVSSYPISNRKLAKRIASKYNINIAIIDP